MKRNKYLCRENENEKEQNPLTCNTITALSLMMLGIKI